MRCRGLRSRIQLLVVGFEKGTKVLLKAQREGDFSRSNHVAAGCLARDRNRRHLQADYRELPVSKIVGGEKCGVGGFAPALKSLRDTLRHQTLVLLGPNHLVPLHLRVSRTNRSCNRCASRSAWREPVVDSVSVA